MLEAVRTEMDAAEVSRHHNKDVVDFLINVANGLVGLRVWKADAYQNL